jgi:hypothetical protein
VFGITQRGHVFASSARLPVSAVSSVHASARVPPLSYATQTGTSHGLPAAGVGAPGGT